VKGIGRAGPAQAKNIGAEKQLVAQDGLLQNRVFRLLVGKIDDGPGGLPPGEEGAGGGQVARVHPAVGVQADEEGRIPPAHVEDGQGAVEADLAGQADAVPVGDLESRGGGVDGGQPEGAPPYAGEALVEPRSPGRRFHIRPGNDGGQDLQGLPVVPDIRRIVDGGSAVVHHHQDQRVRQFRLRLARQVRQCREKGVPLRQGRDDHGPGEAVQGASQERVQGLFRPAVEVAPDRPGHAHGTAAITRSLSVS
jgi:hypothetical protein